jgi:hypothetical protein
MAKSRAIPGTFLLKARVRLAPEPGFARREAR